jgi:nucleotide-binding universal stress UspA family protein
MNRIEFVGNALFIPFFLISVGMLVDFRVLFNGLGALKVAGVMIVMAVSTKFIAAWFTQKTFRLSRDERQLIFGLSNARVGATLAVVLVGYNVILGETPGGVPIRLLNEDVLNGTILMILVTCIISSFAVEKASREIALQEAVKKPVTENDSADKILISLAYPDTVKDLVDLALLLQPDKQKAPLYALHVVSDKGGSHSTEAAGKKMMEKAIQSAAATDNSIIPITRFDLNVSNGIVNTIKEHNITDVVIGLHRHAEEGHAFFGRVAEKIVEGTSESVFIYKPIQPINTLNRIVIAVPANAEYEKGFSQWVNRVVNISMETGVPLVFYAAQRTLNVLRSLSENKQMPANVTFTLFESWDEFLAFTREVKKDDLFVIISSRKGYLSYSPDIDKLPKYLVKYFSDTSYIIMYPAQVEDTSGPDLKPITESSDALGKAGDYVKNIFRKEK